MSVRIIVNHSFGEVDVTETLPPTITRDETANELRRAVQRVVDALGLDYDA